MCVDRMKGQWNQCMCKQGQSGTFRINQNNAKMTQAMLGADQPTDEVHQAKEHCLTDPNIAG